MRLPTIFAVLTAGAMAFAGPTVETPAKRSIADIQQACFVDLPNTINAITPELDCFDDTCTTVLLEVLVNAIDACDGALGTVSSGSQSGTVAIASAFTSSIIGIANSLDSHMIGCGDNCPSLSTGYAGADSSLSATLLAAFDVYTGLQGIILDQVTDSEASTLAAIGFTLTIGVLS